MLQNHLRSLKRNLQLIPGWRTTRKIIVIESDDWGTIRMPDKKTLEILAKTNPKLLTNPMNRLDSLESNQDMGALFEVLDSVKDKNGNPAVLTANTIVANPDFEKIKDSGYKEYYFEPFTQTLKKYPDRDGVEELIRQGIKNNLYRPQFHGREHVNIDQWLSALQCGHKELLNAFHYEVFGINLNEKVSIRNNLMSAFDFDNDEQKSKKALIVKEGINLFEEIFGFKSETFIATTYVWYPDLEFELYKNGVKGLQGIPFQYIPNPGKEKFKSKFHYTGQKNKLGQIYLTRNAFFEPSLYPDLNVLNECLKRIEIAFKWGKPAIIGSHRVNFIGYMDSKNRDYNLLLFLQLLKMIVKKWPDVEFMTSDKLTNLIYNE